MNRINHCRQKLSIVTSIQTSGTKVRFDESASYNPNGSITSLLRGGMKNDGTFRDIDNLTINYNGNQLRKVTDAAEALNYNGALDFNDGANADCEYQYDSNGALTYDSNRGINSITYDYGHHPSEISMMSKKMTLYNDYTPDGRKLSSRHYGMVPKGNGSYRRLNTTDLYIDGLILRDGVPFMWQFDGGYVSLNANATPTSWNYYVTDHLGSTRKVVDSNNNVKETINYYPFGSEMRMQDPAQMAGDSWQSYRFTGKELDKQNGLNWYDFGARWFDVAGVPMWTSVDPLAEKYFHISPYSYCAGDPINKFDPDGRDVVITGPLANMALQQLQSKIGKKVQLSLTNDNYLCYNIVENGRLNKNTRTLIGIIDNSDITVNMITTDKNKTSTGALFVGGAFMGNNVETDANGNVINTTAYQEVNPQVLNEADKYSSRGTFMMHELTEAYEGAKISASQKVSSPNSGGVNSVYSKAHNMATDQPPVYQRLFDKNGRETPHPAEAQKAEWYVKPNISSKDEHTIQTYP